MKSFLPIILLLRKSCRTPEVQKKVEEIAKGLGLIVKTVNRKTVTCAVSTDHFIKHFGESPVHARAQSSGSVDRSTPPADLHEKHLMIPEDLVEYVESVTFQPSSL